MRTIQELAQQLSRFGSRPCLGLRQDLGLRWWSYERLDRGCRQAAVILQRAGVGRGDSVLIRAPNCPEWVAFLLGAALRGAILVPLDNDAPPELVVKVAADVKPRLFVYSGNYAELPDAPSIDLNSLYDEAEPHPFAELTVPVSPADPVIAIHTSGTTALPRRVVLTHGNITSVINRFRRWRPLTLRIAFRIAVMPPLSHTQGLMVGLAIPLSLGLSVIYTESSHPGYLLRMIRDNRVVLLSTVPRVLHVLADLFRRQYYGKGPATLADKLEGIRSFYVRRHYVFTHLHRTLGFRFWVVFVGGAPLPEADERFWRESGCPLVQGYGLTETAAMVSVNAPWSGAFGSVGRALAEQEIQIAEDGEILVRGPNVMAGYAGDDDPNIFSQGFLKTGDIGRLDRNSRLYIVGRKKEVIVTGEGFNVHASDVEAILNDTPGVGDSIVVGLERDGHTQVHAALLLRDGIPPEMVVLNANLRLLSHQRIQSWTVWPDRDFPRTSLLKPRRQMIEALLRAGFGRGSPIEESSTATRIQTPSGNDPTRDHLAELAASIVEEGSPAYPDGHISLVRDLGLGSLDMVELLLLVERQSGRVLDRIDTDEQLTVGRLRSLARDPSYRHTATKPDAKDPPRWSDGAFFNLMRTVMNPLILRTWAGINCKLSIDGENNLDTVHRPVIFACGGHRHGFDLILLYSALPPRLRRNLAVVVSRWVFGGILKPHADTTFRARFAAALGLKLLLPALFPIALSSHFERTREGLMEACRLIDRGYSLVTFEGPGMALVAKQCGVPIMPVRISGNNKLGFIPSLPRPKAVVSFGRLIETHPGVAERHLIVSLDQFFSASNATA